MITNVPTSDELNRSALRHYFSAWIQLLTIATDFDQVFANDDDAPHPIDWSPERESYLKGSQADLQTCCTLIQQSNELALKSRITDVSPYLLLFRNDRRLSQQPEQIDFADLRTLDASDLPRAVNAFCANTMSDAFVADYEFIRKLRNRIVHIGSANRDFDPEENLEKVIDVKLRFAPTAGESVAIALTSPCPTNDRIRTNCVTLGIANIRVIKKIERHARHLMPLISEHHNRVQQQAMDTLCLFAWSKYQLRAAPPLSFLKTKRGGDFAGLGQREDLTAEEAAWNALLQVYGFGVIDDFDATVLEGIELGYFDLERVKVEAAKSHAECVRQDNDGRSPTLGDPITTGMRLHKRCTTRSS